MPEKTDLGSLRLNGGYFLTKAHSAQTESFAGEYETSDPEYVHCYTLHGATSTIKKYAIDLIRGARKKIFVASFRIGDTDINTALTDAARRLIGGVYVISALDRKSLERGISRIEDGDSDDFRIQEKQFDTFTQSGIYVRGHESLHAKFIIVDDEVALVSSANLETRGLSKTGENGVVITNRQDVGALSSLFTKLWYEGCNWEVAPDRQYAVQQRNPTPSPRELPETDRRAPTGVIWTFENDFRILEVIRHTVKTSESELLLSTFSLHGMTAHPNLLLRPVKEAIDKRGVNVSILLRSRNDVPGHREDSEALARLGVKIFGDSLVHAKGVIADRKIGALFSANFDAEHGLTGGVEVGVRLDGRNALKEAHRFFAFIMKYSDHEFVVSPTQREVDARLLAHWRMPSWQKRWPLQLHIKVLAESGVWELFRTSAGKPPVLFVRKPDKPIRLIAGNHIWQLLPTDGTEEYLLSKFTEGSLSSDMNASDLLQRWLHSQFRQSEDRGICPAIIERVSPIR